MVSIMENIAPAKRALAVLDDAPQPADAVGPTRRISKKITTAIDLMVSGECKKIADAARQVGLARESLSCALNKPHVAEFMRQKVVRSLAIAATRAGATKVELLDSASEMVRDRARSFVLGLAEKAGYVIDLSDDGASRQRRHAHCVIDRSPADQPRPGRRDCGMITLDEQQERVLADAAEIRQEIGEFYRVSN
jgi:hypothetical protein